MERIRVVVASPIDVEPERQLAELVARELNHLLGSEKDFAIEICQWKLDGGLGIHQDGYQALIDQRLSIESSDLLIAIFGTRLGTPILISEETGTEHELKLAMKSWQTHRKPQIFVYFKNPQIQWQDIDFIQGQKLQTLRAAFHKGGAFEQCGYSTFETSHDFESQLRKHLSTYLRSRFALPHAAGIVGSTEQLSPAESALDSYLSQRHIAVYAVEAILDGHVPLKEMDKIASCFDSAMSSALKLLQRTTDSSQRVASTRTLEAETLAFAKPAAIIPTGMGATVVWELPHGAERSKQEMALCVLLLDFVGFFQRRLRLKLRELGKPFALYASHVNVRSALSSGKACKRKSPFSSDIYYVGMPMAEILELRRAAGAGEFIVNMKFAPYLLMERLCAGEGRRDCLHLRPPNSACAIWITNRPLKRRVPKREPLDSIDGLLAWADHPYEDDLDWPEDHIPLTEEDVIWVFEMRETWESRFAAELASTASALMERHDIDMLLAPISAVVEEMESLKDRSELAENSEWRSLGTHFHSNIAELSHAEDRAKRKRFAEWVYAFTKPVYAYGMISQDARPKSEGPTVVQEHREILQLIREGKARVVSDMIRGHLESHYERALSSLLSCRSVVASL